jgi:hypothetical protein
MKYKCKYCGYTQDFEPTEENYSQIFNYKIKDNQCPVLFCFKEEAMESI